jgi:hypothetical protein
MKLICIQAYADKRPGDDVDLPVDPPGKDKDGSELPPPWSELYLAEPGTAAAVRAIADRKAADAAAATPATPPVTPAGKPLTPPTPDGKEGT